MSVSINGTSGLTFNDNTTQATAWTPGWRNRIINGDMRIDQRNAGASVTTASGSSAFGPDRFKFEFSATSKFTIQQSATAPQGFVNSLLVTSSSSYTVAASEVFYCSQYIEGLNVSDLGWGTANAKEVTVSFWVRSSLTGTFGGSIQNSAINRSYPFTFTIAAANTWEQKTFTVVGDTSGTWLTTNGLGIVLRFGLGVGSTYSGTAGAWAAADYRSATGATSVVGTNGATFYITGVQLEKGSTATSFEFRSIGQELALCQRYFLKYGDTNVQALAGGGMISTTEFLGYIGFPQEMRATPTLTTSGTFDVRTSAGLTVSAVTFSGGKLSGQISATTSSGTSGAGGVLRVASGGTLLFSSEL